MIFQPGRPFQASFFRFAAPGALPLLFASSVLIIGLLAAGTEAVAASPASGWTLDAVVVTAEGGSRPFQTGDVDVENTTVSVSVIERDQFEGKITDLAEVLEKEAGVQIRRSGGMGGYAEVSLRGSSSEQVMVFLDGVPLNEGSGGGVDLSGVALSDVAAIEIYRGAVPAQLGRAGMGGAVNIVTLRADGETRGKALAGFGSPGTRKAGAFGQYAPENGEWDVLLSADHLEADNDFSYLNDKGTHYNPSDDAVEDRRNAAVRRENLLARAGWNLSDAVRTEAFYQYFRKDMEIPDWRNTPLADASFDTERHLGGLKFIADNIAGTGVNVSALLSAVRKEEIYDDRNGRVGLGRQLDRNLTRQAGLHLFAGYAAKRHVFGFMADFQREDYEPEDRLFHQFRPDSQRQILNLTVQDRFQPWGEEFAVVPSLRCVRIRDERNSGVNTHGGLVAGRKVTADHFNPQIGLIWRPDPCFSVKANLGRCVREPSFSELFGDRGLIEGNADLEAEKGVNFDIGFRTALTPAPDIAFLSWMKRFSLAATFFHRSVDDLITRTYDARGVGHAVNMSEAEIHGLETEFSLDFLRYFRFSANATWQNARNRHPAASMNNKFLPGRWGSAKTLRLEALWKGLRPWMEIEARRDMYYDSVNLLKAADQDLISFGLSWTVSRWTLEAEARNVKDRQFEDFNGYPMPGATYYFTLICDF
ncbi:MAG: hypothetical protein CR990_00445 [Desulfococcus sp.]|nr:MAG: hypothetical protein CR990_00445 [Desulfococcus sp.]